jgi:hypothetical protein
MAQRECARYDFSRQRTAVYQFPLTRLPTWRRAMIDLCLLATIPLLLLLMARDVIDPEHGLLLMLPCGGLLLILALMRRLTRFDDSSPWKT